MGFILAHPVPYVTSSVSPKGMLREVLKRVVKMSHLPLWGFVRHDRVVGALSHTFLSNREATVLKVKQEKITRSANRGSWH